MSRKKFNKYSYIWEEQKNVKQESHFFKKNSTINIPFFGLEKKLIFIVRTILYLSPIIYIYRNLSLISRKKNSNMFKDERKRETAEKSIFKTRSPFAYRGLSLSSSFSL